MSPSPLKTIWYEPRVTIRRILEDNPLPSSILLASLTGINGVLDELSNRNLGDEHSLPIILLAAVIIGPIAGLIAIWIFSFILKWSGNPLGGTGDIKRIAAALAWSSLPGLIGLIFWAPQLYLFGSEMFREEMPALETKPYLLAAIIGFDGLSVVFSFWGMIMLCFMLAEAQHFASAWRGLANLLLAIALVVSASFVIGFAGVSF